MRRSLEWRIVLVAVGIATGCGSSGPHSPPPPPPGDPYAGTYATTVTLTQNACGQVTVQNNPTIVTHNAASGAVTLTHAGQTYPGTVNGSGAFTTTPTVVDVSDGFLYTIGLAGQFGTGSFAADATVDRSSQASGTCRFVVHWAATRNP
jgi:hypothetical protein